MEVISLLEWLVNECYAHNAAPLRLTDKSRLENARKVIAVLKAAFNAEGDKKDG
jgi:hypothetical protein